MTAEEWVMEVMATVVAPRFLPSSAPSMGTLLRPELEIRNSTSFSPTPLSATTVLPSSGRRSKALLLAPPWCSISEGSKIGDTQAIPPAR